MRKALLTPFVIAGLLFLPSIAQAQSHYKYKTFREGYGVAANWIKYEKPEYWYSPSTGKLVSKKITAWCNGLTWENKRYKLSPNAVKGCVAAIKELG